MKNSYLLLLIWVLQLPFFLFARDVQKNSASITNGSNSISIQQTAAFVASFDENGMSFSPYGSELEWQWQLTGIYAGTRELLKLDSCTPPIQLKDSIAYLHGPITELYLPAHRDIEQQFILSSKPQIKGQDLLIEGAVITEGQLKHSPQGWIWEKGHSRVSLGKVYVYDADGHRIPAEMEVSQNHTRIRVDGQALERASYPVTVDPKIGLDEFRISVMGPNSDGTWDAVDPAIAFNPTHNEFMVVWSGDVDDTFSPGEEEIYGQRISALTGLLVGSRFRISNMGPNLNGAYDADNPAIVWNDSSQRYLVVWTADSDAPLTNGKNEIWGQLLTHTGSQTGPDDFRISFTASNTNTSLDALDPSVAWNSVDNLYMVVWSADTIEGDFEVYGQLLDTSTAAIGSQIRISSAGPEGNVFFDGEAPHVVYNPVNNEFLVSWFQDAIGSPGEDEIFVRRYNGTNAAPLDTAYKISDVGPVISSAYDAADPAIAWNSDLNQYLVVWEADDTTGSRAEGEFEIYGQLLDSAANEIGPNDFLISDLGLIGNNQSDAGNPRVVYSSSGSRYMVAFEGDSVGGGGADGEKEIYFHFVDPNGLLIGDDTTLSSAGPPGFNLYDAEHADLAVNPANGQYLIVWNMDDNMGGMINGEDEIFGQAWSNEPPCQLAIGNETVSACDSFTWINGITYTSSTNTPQFTFAGGAANGCDSVLSLDLTILTAANSVDMISACDSFTWIDGVTYTSTNNTAQIILTGAAANGCDSIINLDLTITGPSNGVDQVAACDSFTWIDGITYFSNNNAAQFTLAGGNANGCDSVVNLDLTILAPSNGVDVVAACDSFTWIDGITYFSNNNSAQFTLAGGNANGCDSVVNLDLTILAPSNGVDVVAACDSFTWIDGITYFSNNNSAQFTLAGGNANGCDSVVNLDLTINLADTSITINTNQLQANASGASYQWVNCDSNFSAIPGETSQVFEPTRSGNYAAIIQQNGCIDTSGCVELKLVSNVPQLERQGFQLFPNPTRGRIQLEFFQIPKTQIELKVLDLNGRQVFGGSYSPGLKHSFEFSELPQGVYLIEVRYEQKLSCKKLILN